MKKYLLLLLVLVIFHPKNNYSQTDEKLKPYELVKVFDPEREPQKDLNAAIFEAKKSKRRILLDVGGEWCIWCKRLDSFFVADKDLNNLLHKNFVVMKVNFSKENKNENFLSKFPKIPGYPHFFVLERNGKFLYSQDTGKLESGKGYDKQKIKKFIQKWRPKK